MTTSEKVAYLKGLAEGMNLEDAGQGKLLHVIMDILEDLALDLADTKDSLVDLTDSVDDLIEEVGALDDELADLQMDDEDEEDAEEDDEDDDEVFYRVTCPGCGFQLTVGESIVDEGSFECPECGKLINFNEIQMEEVEFEDLGTDE